jgi:hypothetical protein
MRMAALWPLGLVLAASSAGCMGSDEAEPQTQGAGVGIGRPVQLVNCADWREASVRERQATVQALEEFAGGRSGSPGGRGATLEEDEAYDLFERSCDKEFARGFKLYKLYTRAAAFRGQ